MPLPPRPWVTRPDEVDENHQYMFDWNRLQNNPEELRDEQLFIAVNENLDEIQQYALEAVDEAETPEDNIELMKNLIGVLRLNLEYNRHMMKRNAVDIFVEPVTFTLSKVYVLASQVGGQPQVVDLVRQAEDLTMQTEFEYESDIERRGRNIREYQGIPPDPDYLDDLYPEESYFRNHAPINPRDVHILTKDRSNFIEMAGEEADDSQAGTMRIVNQFMEEPDYFDDDAHDSIRDAASEYREHRDARERERVPMRTSIPTQAHGRMTQEPSYVSRQGRGRFNR